MGTDYELLNQGEDGDRKELYVAEMSNRFTFGVFAKLTDSQLEPMLEDNESQIELESISTEELAEVAAKLLQVVGWWTATDDESKRIVQEAFAKYDLHWMEKP